MLQHLARRRPPLRIQRQQPTQQIHSRGRQHRKPRAYRIAAAPCRLGRQSQRPRVRQPPEPRPRLVRRQPAQRKDAGELVDLVLALQQGLAADEELAEDAADGPEVDGGRVAGGAEEELGGAVPEGDDEGGEVLRGRVADVARHAEVGNLEAAAVGEEEVGGFEVPVEDVVRVEVGEAGGELEEEGFHFGGEEGLGLGFEDGF